MPTAFDAFYSTVTNLEIQRDTPAAPRLEPRCPCCGHVVEIDLAYPCPVCDGPIALRHNRASGQPFVGCSRFPKCKWTMPVHKFLIYSKGGPRSKDETKRLITID